MTAAEVVARLEGARKVGGSWTARCPAHEDMDPSLSIEDGEKGVLLHCHAGCDFASIVAALGLQPGDLFHENGADRARKEIVDTYDYVDEDGELLFQVVRFFPKDFRQRRPDGRGGWAWKLGDTHRVLYRLPEIIEAVAHGKLVHVVEGEKDVHAVERAGGIATTAPMGAGKWRPEYSEVLRDARVRIVADRDPAGLDHARAVAEALNGTASTVEVVQARKGKDAADHLAAGHELDDFERVELRAEDVSIDDSLTDSGNSERFAQLHGERLRYVPQWGKWIVCDEDDAFWVLDHGDVHVRELAKDVGRSLKLDAAREADSSRARKLFSWGLTSLNSHRIGSLVNLARGIEGIPIEHEQLDADGWLLGVENGVIDLRTGRLRQARPEDLMTRRCPVVWDPSAEAPRFRRAMEEWFPESDVRSYVQRLAGAALPGFQRDHVFVIHYGGGRNGKGTFMRALQRVLGRYARVIHLSLLIESKYSEHDTVKAELFRSRLAVASETQRRVKLDEASVKNLSGGDRITARRMREDPWEFDPSHALWLQTNHLPEIGGRDTGIWSRIKVLKWVATFEGEAQDQGLDETLAGEAPGILRWLVEGCLEWQKHDLREPESVVRDTLAYRRSEDILGRFQEDMGLTFAPELQIPAGDLQDMLSDWASADGIDPPSQQLGEWLKENGARQTRKRYQDESGKTRQRRFWVGVGTSAPEHRSEQTNAL